MKTRILLYSVLLLVVLVVVGVATGRFSQANAQENGANEHWGSSAEAPAGTTIEQFSPADDPALYNLQENLESPEGLVSWRVTGSALKPRENDVSYSVGSDGGCTYVTAGDASTVWNIPVDLPQGTVVDTLRMYYYDISGSNSTGWFTIYDLYGEIVNEWGVSTSGNFGNSFNDSVQINHTIDYSVYSYLLNWRPSVTGSTMQLCGFRIFHNPPFFGAEYLPVIQNGNP